ncbi:choice-of-anchor A family protein [Methylophilus luteus]|uniref:Collagen-binding domain-containing protein n=1 Tax=Methylophilus luteus TaxID=640108 RepID=A0ABW3F808_9PROT
MKSIIKQLAITVLSLQALSASAGILDLGVAGQYNVFVFENFTSSNSDVEGAIAVGGHFEATNYAVNELNRGVAGNALVVGKSLNFRSGSVKNGNIDVAGTRTTSSFGFSGAYSNSNPVDFASERTYLQNLSLSLNNLGNTGTASYQYSGLQLTASNSTDAQIFDIDGSLFNSRNNTTFSGFANGQTIILNISGDSLRFDGGTGNDFGKYGFNVIYNFYEATALNTGSGATGSILAPLADITGGYTAINGNVIGKSWNTNTQVNVKGMFQATEVAGLPVSAVPEPESYAMLLAGLGIVGLLARKRQYQA